MFKSFLLKTLILLIALAAVLAVIVAVTRGDFGAGATEAGETQTFFEQFVIAGGPIVWFVLLPMSLVMVYLTAEYSLTIRYKKLFPDGIGRRIVEIMRRFGPRQLEAKIGGGNDFVSTAVVRAVTQGRDDWFRMRNLLFESLEEQALRLMRKIEWVNLIGNVSPMVGLFGTVFGMIKLFNAIVTAGGQPQPAQLAHGISVALVTTFWGLLIAIPSLAIHGVFRNRIETLIGAATAEAENILPEIMRGLKQPKGPEQPKQKKPAVKSEIREVAGKPMETFRESSAPSR
ncbi:MAG: MotA/TolQ/ExbB proton channel family protein [Planctomycetota bacterium]|jgi:biopolymer transport protein ExbB